MQNHNLQKSIIGLALGTACILLIPLVAMQFTDEVKWSVFDFVFMGTLLFCTGLAYVLVSRRFRDIAHHAAVGIAVMTALLLIWVNGAVGIIGNEGNTANALYFGVLAIGIIGVAIARFRPQAMAHAMFATALAQALVPIIALVVWRPLIEETPGVIGVFILNAFFVILWAESGLLFKYTNLSIVSWTFGAGVFVVGSINTFWGNDPGFGIFLILLSLTYFLPINSIIKKWIGLSIPKIAIAKIVLGIFILWAALGVGELFDKIELMMNTF